MVNEKEKRLREFIRRHYLEGKGASETYRLCATEFKLKPNSVAKVQKWFRRFKEGDYNLTDRPRSGRPVICDEEEILRDVELDPNQSTRTLAKKYKCSPGAIFRALKRLAVEKVDGFWVRNPDFDIKKEVEKPEIEKNVVELELTLEQKIYIVGRYYEGGRDYNLILEEFDEKYQVETTETLEETLKCVVRSFETVGSITNEIFCEVWIEMEKKDDPKETHLLEKIILEDPKPNKRVYKPKINPEIPKSLGEKMCPICKKKISASYYANHLRVHSDTRPFICEICSRGFKTRKNLMSHAQVHKPISERKTHICPICGHSSTLTTNYNKHLRLAHPEESFKKPARSKPND